MLVLIALFSSIGQQAAALQNGYILAIATMRSDELVHETPLG
jgi:hypothetical protein